MSSEQRPITKWGRKLQVRILRPSEYARLWEGAETTRNKVRLDTLLYTGMRYVEVKRLHENPSWFDGHSLHLPPSAMFKAMRRMLDRWVNLNERGRGILPLFLKDKNLPGYSSFGQSIEQWARNAGLDPIGLGPKSLRKTWESWLVFMYPSRSNEIALSQGHDALTQLRYYLNMPFLESDKTAMRPYVEGIFEDLKTTP